MRTIGMQQAEGYRDQGPQQAEVDGNHRDTAGRELTQTDKDIPSKHTGQGMQVG